MNLQAMEVPIHLLNLTDQQKRIKQGTDVAVCNTAESVLVENRCPCEVQTNSSSPCQKRKNGAGAGVVSKCSEQSARKPNGELAGVGCASACMCVDCD